MLNSYRLLATLFSFMISISAVAQDQSTNAASSVAAVDDKQNVLKSTPKSNVVETESQPAKKMVQDATINLQTTITGNQEQPRVLYILPWQSPKTSDVDFEPLDNQQKAVFGHIEREELRRELESAGELE